MDELELHQLKKILIVQREIISRIGAGLEPLSKTFDKGSEHSSEIDNLKKLMAEVEDGRDHLISTDFNGWNESSHHRIV